MSNRHLKQHLMQAKHQHKVKELFLVTESEHSGHKTTKTVHVKIGRNGVEHLDRRKLA